MKKNKRTMDLTAGNPLVQIFLFSLPLVFGTLFQQLYSFADTVIVGRFLGVSALGAVGSTYSLHFLTLGFVQGACIGFGIPIAQSFGAKNRDDIHRYLWNGMWLCLMMALLLTVVMFLLPLRFYSSYIRRTIFSQWRSPISASFSGIPTSILYNYSASALRAFGDSRHPFISADLQPAEHPARLSIDRPFPYGRRRRRMGDRSQSTDQRTVKYMVAFKQNRTD